MFDVITLGSATKDIFLEASKFKKGTSLDFPLGKKIEIEKTMVFSGGGGVNAAHTFVFQGLKTGLCSWIGQDFLGKEIIKELKKIGVDTRLVQTKNEATDLGLILHAGDERTILLHHGPSRNLAEKDLPWTKLKKTRWLYLAPLWGKSIRLTQPLAEFARRNKIRLALNPSLDQLSLPDIRKTIREIDVLILNDEEAANLAQIDPFSEEAVFEKIASLTRALIVVTQGKQGAAALDGRFLYRLPAPPARVVDATGAGDSFGSGLVAGIIQGKAPEESLRLAMANAIANIQVFGANQGLLRKDQPLLKIKVKKIRWSV
ncbi:MAG: carbohydrate kinase family protein [Candidatus Nealsonbacteria bacterium]|nr:carbohydrate kinase family protein [Candidatus Nealsonbacteria bacterium]